jgi:hypothetical protein
LGVINLHHVPLFPKPYLPYTHNIPLGAICHAALRCPCYAVSPNIWKRITWTKIMLFLNTLL